MITAKKERAALSALNAVLVLARSLAHEGRTADLVVVLDIAEYLPMLMLQPDDRTTEFRDQLLDLAQRYPPFGLAVERFDGES